MNLYIFFWIPYYQLIHHSLENDELEQMLSFKDKSLHVYKWHTPQLASDPTTMPIMFQFLIHNLVRVLLFLLTMLLLIIFILILINVLPFEKANEVVIYILCIILSYAHLFSPFYSFVSSIDSHSILKSVSEVLSDSDWRSAVQEEMTALKQNDTWDLLPLPPGKKVIYSCWVYIMKLNPNGSLALLKARLVTKGYFRWWYWLLGNLLPCG